MHPKMTLRRMTLKTKSWTLKLRFEGKLIILAIRCLFLNKYELNVHNIICLYQYTKPELH